MSFVLSVARQSYLSIHYWQPSLLGNDVSASAYTYQEANRNEIYIIRSKTNVTYQHDLYLKIPTNSRCSLQPPPELTHV